MNKAKIYLASPMASTQNREQYKYSESRMKRNQDIALFLRKQGFEVFLPQENQKETGLKTLEVELAFIKECDCLVAVLSETRGVYLEAGYAKGVGKKTFGLEVEETRKYSDWTTAFFEGIAKNKEELVGFIKAQAP